MFLWCLVLGSWSFSSPASTPATFSTIITNGPSTNRFNIVFLSEGYTSAQQPQFLVDATNAFASLLAHQPYLEYSNYFNAYTIQTNSAQSGSDHPAYPTSVNTAFNSTFDANDYIISIPPNFADGNSTHGQGKVDTLLATFMPGYSLSVLLVNDLASGGSDGFDKTAIASTSAALPEILTHECGHVIANLGDEYTVDNPGFPNTEEPNTTTQTNRALIKWNAWIDPSTPVPTTPQGSYPASVGLFQGAHYHTNGWYRPKLDCLMNHLYAPLCEVCQEAIIIALYREVRPVESFSPASTNLSTATNQSLSFSVTLLQPATHNLTVQWYTNNVAVPNATNTSFSLLPLALTNGATNRVKAIVHDPTTLVRTDPTNLLTQTIQWTVAVTVPQLSLDSSQWLPSGKFKFRLTGVAPSGFVIQGSTNFTSWTSLRTSTFTAGQFWYTNTSASNFTRRYFRAYTPP